MDDVLECADESCSATIGNHAWGRVKSGWFEQKDGRVWCPLHTPPWVAEWRARKRNT